MTEYGPEIAVNGTRPEWLKNGEQWQLAQGDLWVFGDSNIYSYHWFNIQFIRLPADHPYYLATSKGFEYWPGGDKAPSDWDRVNVLFGSGISGVANDSASMWIKYGTDYDIIGYRKRKGLPEVPADATMPDDWAIKAAHKDVYGTELSELVLKRYKQGDYSDGKAVITLARMIQQYQPHRKPEDPDVLAVSEIIRAWDDMPTIDKDGQYFQAALAAYKKHK